MLVSFMWYLITIPEDGKLPAKMIFELNQSSIGLCAEQKKILLFQVWGVEESSSRAEVAQIERSASYTSCFQRLGSCGFPKAMFQYKHKMHFKLNININICVCVCICTYVCICVHICVYVFICVCVCIYIYIYSLIISHSGLAALCWAVLSLPVVSHSLRPHRLQFTRLLCPWDSPSENTRLGCHALFQEIFPTQGYNWGLLHCRQILYQLSYQESPAVLQLPLTQVDN